LSGGWFFWNLIAISAIHSKSPNFIYQSYLPGLFFSIYTPLLYLENRTTVFSKLENQIAPFFCTTILRLKLAYITLFIALVTILSAYSNMFKTIKQTRMKPYVYRTQHEQYYHFAETEQKNGINQASLFILNATANDCWFRYYILFLTGAEARTFNELLTYNISLQTLQLKYKTLHLVVESQQTVNEMNIPHTSQNIDGFHVLTFDVKSLDQRYLEKLKSWIMLSSKQIYSSHASCRWMLATGS
jgi:hypothetical protein